AVEKCRQVFLRFGKEPIVAAAAAHGVTAHSALDDTAFLWAGGIRLDDEEVVAGEALDAGAARGGLPDVEVVVGCLGEQIGRRWGRFHGSIQLDTQISRSKIADEEHIRAAE